LIKVEDGIDYAGIEQELRKRIERGITKASIIVENDAKGFCPVDTSYLKNSITHLVKNLIGIVFTNVEYGPYVEYGTAHSKEQSFLRRSLIKNKQVIAEEIAKELRG